MEMSKVQDLADKFTNETLTEVFGERFTSLEDVEQDEEINEAWEILNEKFYESIVAIF